MYYAAIVETDDEKLPACLQAAQASVQQPTAGNGDRSQYHTREENTCEK
jgi:hypothetical protein